MGEILGICVSHYPPLSGLDENMAGILGWTLEDPDIPADAKDVTTWPQEAQDEWADPTAAARRHREALVTCFDKVRESLDRFDPDVVVIWGDDQYENFREDVIPPYAVLCYSDLEIKPWAQMQESGNLVGKPNAWGEPMETSFTIKGRPDIGKHLTTRLLEQGIDAAYAYKQLHHPGLPHAFLNAILYLDYHRQGWPWPVIPFAINCYGRRVVSYKGIFSRFGDKKELDPPSAMPWRYMEVGAAVAWVFRESPWRVALLASSSWSHAFLCDKTCRSFPDTESDRKVYEALQACDWEAWRKTTLDELEDAAQQELLNWWPLAGAMEELGRRPTWTEFIPTWIFNSNKVFAIFEP